MLVLSRKEQETLVIGDDVFVTIVEIRHGQVRLAINAPRSVSVHRKEVWLKIKNGVATSQVTNVVGQGAT
ncbi:MAG: carbon storage regulator CsrA [Pirellulaceae bacterium]|nr:carbon storage regulator CsrA [Pirellulaceae bacterium]